MFVCCSFRPEVDTDVISGANVGQVGKDVPVKFGDLPHMAHVSHYFLPLAKFDHEHVEVNVRCS